MRAAVVFAVLLFSTSGFACDAEQALREYYWGIEIKELTIKLVRKNLYSIAYYDEDAPAHCTGGLARVNKQCRAVAVRALYCKFE